ncbi:MAG: hypothetical protein ACE37F_30720 [Nannocystaceae bacterium]|nr:hypothetical protein [bacterium]
MLLRAVSLVLVETMVSSTTIQPAQRSPIIAARPADDVQTLHRKGEELYDSGDYGGAREAWVGAYAQVEPTPEQWPYRTTLLSLIVTTTLAEFSAGGDRERVREVATLLDEALEAELEEELHALLQGERDRLDPYLDPEPPPPTAVEAPQDVEPVTSPRKEPPERTIPNPVWIAGGGALLAGGLAGIIIGSRFTPRAEQMVIDSGMPANEPPSSTFLDEERSKGNAWMITGSVLAAAGTAALVVGIVRLVRDR